MKLSIEEEKEDREECEMCLQKIAPNRSLARKPDGTYYDEYVQTFWSGWEKGAYCRRRYFEKKAAENLPDRLEDLTQKKGTNLPDKEGKIFVKKTKKSSP